MTCEAMSSAERDHGGCAAVQDGGHMPPRACWPHGRCLGMPHPHTGGAAPRRLLLQLDTAARVFVSEVRWI